MYNRISLMSYCTLLYLGIGGYWVSLSWTVLGITHNQNSVGKLLIIGALCTLFLAPMIGMVVDKVGFRVATLIGQGFGFIVGLMPAVITNYGYLISPFILYLMSLMITISSILCISSFDRALKLTIPQVSLKRTRTLVTVFQQVAMMLGTALSGFLISGFGELSVFPLFSLFSLINTLIFYLGVRNSDNKYLDADTVSKSHWSSLVEGIYYIIRSKPLLISSLCIAIAYASAQVVNVSLPAFIRLELGQGSNIFGLCEGLWALGGILSAIIATTLLVKLNFNWLPIASLTTLGFSMICFGQFSNPYVTLFLCLVMGSFFTIARSLADANLISSCSYEMIGRVRANTMAVTSLIGILIYLIPVVIDNILPSTLYLLIGLLTVFISVLLFNLYRNKKVSPLVLGEFNSSQSNL